MTTFVKICGITSLDDALACVDAGADAIGFNFWPQSKRHVPVERAAAIAKRLPPNLRTVGVFVDPTEAEVDRAFASGAVDLVQLHGDETPDFCRRFSRPLHQGDALARRGLARRRWPSTPATSCSSTPTAPGYGGSGQRADVGARRRAAAAARRVILAGGLTPENVAEAVAAVRPVRRRRRRRRRAAPGVKDWIEGRRLRAGGETWRTKRARVMSEADAGHFGPFGGRFVAETLIPALDELDARLARRPGRPRVPAPSSTRSSPTTSGARRASRSPIGCRAPSGGDKRVRIYLKREDLNHTGAHKINNCIGQALLARRMGKRRIIAETGAGQHGVATATVAAKFGLPCEVYMGAEDVERQELNVFRMRLLGAQVHAVESGTRTLKDAMNEALRDWVTNVRDTHYIIGSVAGPHPYPTMVRDLQAVIGREARAQVLERDGRLPDAAVACVGGGSNAMGLFHAFVGDAACSSTASRRRGRASPPAGTRRRWPRGASACCTARNRTCSATTTARSCRRTRSRPGSTIPASAPSTRGSSNRAARPMRRSPTPRRWRRCSCWRAPRASCARSRRRTRSRICRGCARRLPDGAIVVVGAVGARRQGHAHGGQGAGSRLVNAMRRIVWSRAWLRSPRRRKGARRLRDCRRSVARRDAGHLGRDRARRRRRHRARRAVVRSVGRRRRSSSTPWSARCRRAAPGTTRSARRSTAVRALRRESEVPVVLFGYYNPLLQRGLARVADEARDAGVDGMLVVDLPPEESVELDGELDARRPVARAAAGADDDAGACAHHRRARIGLRLLRRAHRRHRRRPPRRRRRRRGAPRRCARRSARCRSPSASACASRRARGRWHRTATRSSSARRSCKPSPRRPTRPRAAKPPTSACARSRTR